MSPRQLGVSVLSLLRGKRERTVVHRKRSKNGLIQLRFIPDGGDRLDKHSKQGVTHVRVDESRPWTRAEPQLQCRIGERFDKRSIRMSALAEYLPHISVVQTSRVIQEVSNGYFRETCRRIVGKQTRKIAKHWRVKVNVPFGRQPRDARCQQRLCQRARMKSSIGNNSGSGFPMLYAGRAETYRTIFTD